MTLDCQVPHVYSLFLVFICLFLNFGLRKPQNLVFIHDVGTYVHGELPVQTPWHQQLLITANTSVHQTPFPTQPSSLLLHGPIDGLVEHRRVDMVKGLLLSSPASTLVAPFFQFCWRV